MSSRAMLESKKRQAPVSVVRNDQESARRPLFPAPGASMAERSFFSPVSTAAFSHDFSRISVQFGDHTGDLRRGPCPLVSAASPRACPFGGACHACPVRVQTKLAANQPGDADEHEADRKADGVMRMSEPPRGKSPLTSVNSNPPIVHKKCARCDDDDKPVQKEELPERNPGDSVRSKAVPPIVHEVLRSSGRPLDEKTRVFMESRFCQDFSRVRVHSDAKAAESARAVHAQAYTVGQSIVFGAQRYAPMTETGQWLLAHELAHAVQQNGGAVNGSELTVSGPDDAAEGEAEHMAHTISRGNSIVAPPISVSAKIQRMVFVRPAEAARDILEQFKEMCPGKFGVVTASGAAQITAGCSASDRTRNKSCECLCDTAHDKKRQYSIIVRPAVKMGQAGTLADGTPVPGTSLFPHTMGDEHPAIFMPSSHGSTVEFGAFQANGKPLYYKNKIWRILAHELCGHGRLKQRYGDQSTGCRRLHNATIDTENEIAGEHGGAKRGRYTDLPRQGESFYDPDGDHRKIVFYLCDHGVPRLHYEAPE